MVASIKLNPEKLKNDFDAGPDAFDTFFSIFKKNYPERIGNLANYIKEGSNFDQMYGVAHTVKGSVSYFRLEELTKICVSMEDAIKTHDLEKITKQYEVYRENLDFFLKEITTFLEKK